MLHFNLKWSKTRLFLIFLPLTSWRAADSECHLEVKTLSGYYEILTKHSPYNNNKTMLCLLCGVGSTQRTCRNYCIEFSSIMRAWVLPFTFYKWKTRFWANWVTSSQEQGQKITQPVSSLRLQPWDVFTTKSADEPNLLTESGPLPVFGPHAPCKLRMMLHF